MIDLARNPDDDSEVRLLYHKIVAPTKGVLGWAGGDSMAFDFVFTGAESMEASEVQALVKVMLIVGYSKYCLVVESWLRLPMQSVVACPRSTDSLGSHKDFYFSQLKY